MERATLGDRGDQAWQARDAADIRTHLRDFASRGLISAYAVPEQVVFMEALPKTSVGKIDKKVLREKYAQ